MNNQHQRTCPSSQSHLLSTLTGRTLARLLDWATMSTTFADSPYSQVQPLSGTLTQIRIPR